MSRSKGSAVPHGRMASILSFVMLVFVLCPTVGCGGDEDSETDKKTTSDAVGPGEPEGGAVDTDTKRKKPRPAKPPRKRHPVETLEPPFDVPVEVPPLKSLNGRALPTKPAGAAFRFLAIGHIYGMPGQSAPSPARSLIRAVPQINDGGFDLVVSLGDCFKKFRDLHVDPTIEALAKLDMPVVNAVGNHDMTDRRGYVERFGGTFGNLRVGSSLLCFVDTEATPWNIVGQQLEALRKTVRSAAIDDAIRNVFFFGHKVIYSTLPRYAVLFRHVNAHDGLLALNNFRKEVHPLLTQLGKAGKGVYWFAGDIGAPRTSFGLFHDRHARTGVTYLATGISDRVTDAGIAVDVDGEGRVTLSSLGLGIEKIEALDRYGRAYWKRLFYPDGLPESLGTFMKSDGRRLPPLAD